MKHKLPINDKKQTKKEKRMDTNVKNKNGEQTKINLQHKWCLQHWHLAKSSANTVCVNTEIKRLLLHMNTHENTANASSVSKLLFSLP